MSKLKRDADIILILIISFVLRLLGAVFHSYSNDELSAVSRLRYNTFSDLIELGVMKGDMHPAGVQVFMKIWSLVFGKSELAMRLPFILLSIGSIYLLYLLGKKWFSRNVGLTAAGLLAVLYFPVINTEFARPYSVGLFFTLFTAYHFYRMLIEGSYSVNRVVFLSIGFAGAMYAHYFAFFFVLFIGFTGLFLLNKSTWKPYLISAALAALLFTPHIEITIYHLSVGGLQWLAPPAPNWLPDFLFFGFNESLTVIAVLIVFMLWGWLMGKAENKIEWRKWILVAIWFFGIYAIGHFYSYIGTPILKFPVMLFAFPFFLLLISIPISRIPSSPVPLLGLGLVALVSTIQEKSYLQNEHFALFKEPGIKMAEWRELYGMDSIYTIYNLNNPEHINFYKDEWGGEPLKFDWSIIDYGDNYRLFDSLSLRSENYCVLGFSSRNTLVQNFETVRYFYPKVVDFEQYNNGAVFLLHKSVAKSVDRVEETLAAFNKFAKMGEWIYVDSLTQESDNSSSFYQLDDDVRTGPTYAFKLKDLPEYEGYLKVIVSADLPENAALSITFSAKRNGKPIYHQKKPIWIGHDIESMINFDPQNKGFFAFKIPPQVNSEDELFIQLWNRSGHAIAITDFTIQWVQNIWNPPFNSQ